MPEGASLNLQLEERLYLQTVLDEMVLRCAGVAVSVCGPLSMCTGVAGSPSQPCYSPGKHVANSNPNILM